FDRDGKDREGHDKTDVEIKTIESDIEKEMKYLNECNGNSNGGSGAPKTIKPRSARQLFLRQ
ncbi:MAG: hypothetical protein PHQ13_12950, partial [Rhodoferax sp.]|nr:hypothetical protein [Rhodoferax sp.]